ncbi:folate transporter 1, chloroplastic isoform X1 [Medicago truncatula]|uniref:folate transporter 1, chloroplastic isoform X1 n=1 Tax=Medicago truncatula TaxID=3880 RepID=UPI001966E2C6|nr:folate transporter 1, chloroplastic-like isoform X1 [Medicago truncatula]
MLTVPPKRNRLRWESTVAVGAAGLTTLAIKYPLDIVQTRFEVNDRRLFSQFPKYNGTVHAIFTIARTEGLKGLYAGFLTKTIGPFIALSAYLSCYSKYKQGYARSKEAKQSDAKSREEPFRPSLAATLQSAALVSLRMHESFYGSEDKIAASDTASSGTAILWDIWSALHLKLTIYSELFTFGLTFIMFCV